MEALADQTPARKTAKASFGQRGANLVLLLIVAAALAASAFFYQQLGLGVGRNEYNIYAWELRNFGSKWLFLLGRVIRGGASQAEQDSTITRFFLLTNQIDDLERQLGDDASDATRLQLRDALAERDRIENQVEATIEGRITAIAEEEGLDLHLFLLPDIVWPPVDMEFTAPIRTLATSPRDHIELLGSTLLREGLTIEEIEAIETARESKSDVSALAFSTGGVGAYPTLIVYPNSYSSAVEVAAHEWAHNYLAFHALGLRYYQNNDLRTMNETVADIVGREMATAILERWPVASEGSTNEPAAARGRQRRQGLRAALRELRGEVEELLAAGKIEEAETLMEERRRSLTAEGFYIRKINQAYFAYVNLYAGAAGSPGAVNPIGPKLDNLRQRSASLGDFLRVVQGFKSVADLDRALEQASGQ